jgi:peptidoglycan/LPS O-acetylase OafA/YrhL
VATDTDAIGLAVTSRAAEPARADAPAVTRRKPSWQTRPLGYQPALDGLRALAVGLVVAYHLGYSGVAGGYIGVEVFFVLSGWLVCALLMNEHQRTGGIALVRFWLRRARRLLPAVVTVIAGTVVVASVVQPERLAELRTQSIAALAYHLNWRLIVDERSYFDAAGGPSPLEHLWSLSIEEQFYLVFPLLCGLVLTRWSRKWAVGIALGGALAATAWRFALYQPGDDPARVYFGTDTRASGLLLGVALGVFWTPNRLRPHTNPRFTALLDVVALAGAAVLAWYALRLGEHRPVSFLAGFTAAQLATLALIAVAVYPAPTRTAWLLSTRPLRWVGVRSYGIYLIHWPVIVFLSTAPGEQPEAPVDVAAQLCLVLGLAALSYRVIEQPIRHRGVGGVVDDARRALGALSARRPLAAGAVIAAGVVVGGLVVGATRDVLTASTPEVAQPDTVVIASDDTVPSTTAPPVTPSTTALPAAPAESPSDGDDVAVAPGFPATTAIGDSVLVGAAPAIAGRMGPAFSADAAIGRQMADARDLVVDLAARDQLGHVVLLHLGNNGPFTAEEIDAVIAAIGPDRTVLLVNVLVPRRWEAEVNDQLAAAAARHEHVVLVDWRSLVTTEEGLTRDDGYHLTAEGAERYADLVVGQVPRG